MDAALTAALAAIRDGVGAYGPQLAALQKQVDHIDRATQDGRFGAPIETKSLIDHLKENDSVSRLMSDKRGVALLRLEGSDTRALQRKTVITSTSMGSSVSGVLPIQRLPDITPEARQQLMIRDLLTSFPTNFQVLDFVRVSVPMSIASPAPEASTKAENQLDFASVSERVKTIATWIPASKQILDDLSGLASFINGSLLYYLDLSEELEMLSGDGVGESLHGIIPQSSSFNTSSLVPAKGWTKIDVIGRAIQQITAAKELPPTFIVLNPNDWWDMRLEKDSFGKYLLEPPQQLSLGMNLFGLDVVSTVNIARGTFLVGTGSPAAIEIADRLESIVEISTETGNNFIQNLVTVRAEKRLALLVRRPASFVSGTFSTSP